MTVAYSDEWLTILEGDCLDEMRAMPEASVDAVCTDPPYGLEFMGRDWDKLDTYPGGNPDMKRHSRAMPGLEMGVSYGAPQKSHRCRKCGKLLRGNGACKCPEPDVDYRRDEGGFQMQSWHERWAREAHRVLKPGGHLLAFGGTRTYHRLACAVEDAGFEIRDCLVWAYASGFPKSLDVAKAIDKAAGAVRPAELVPTKPGNLPDQAGPIALGATGMTDASGPVTDEARRWDGWGTALKPAWEPIVMARKPLRGSVSRNVLAHGTGALNIDGARIPVSLADRAAIEAPNGFLRPGYQRPRTEGTFMEGTAEATAGDASRGRWPANLMLTDPIFDGDVPGVEGGGETATGIMKAGTQRNPDNARNAYGEWQGSRTEVDTPGDSGTYSRFFLVPKADRSERERNLEGRPRRATLIGAEGLKVNPMTGRASVDPPRANTHPTVKPVELMEHLVRLVTPPGGLVLDPFLGSGSTAVAANRLGFRCVGIEREPEYVEIAVGRVAGRGEGALEIGLGL